MEDITCLTDALQSEENQMREDLKEMVKKLKQERRFNDILLRLLSPQ